MRKLITTFALLLAVSFTTISPEPSTPKPQIEWTVNFPIESTAGTVWSAVKHFNEGKLIFAYLCHSTERFSKPAKLLDNSGSEALGSTYWQELVAEVHRQIPMDASSSYIDEIFGYNSYNRRIVNYVKSKYFA